MLTRCNSNPLTNNLSNPLTNCQCHLTPGPLSNSCSNLSKMTIGRSNPKEANLNDYMFACWVFCYMVYYVALDDEFAPCACLGFWQFHLSGNQAIYSMIAVEEDETS